jgi:L-methionine (R)-S-oxide reductase
VAEAVERRAVLDADHVVRALQAAFARDVTREQLLQVVADKLKAAGPPYSGVYLYMLHGDMLALEAFAGRVTPHTRIPVGTGLCGRAVAEGHDIVAADVNAAPGYLACNLETRSELIVLIRRGAEVLGQIDVDSDLPNAFPAAEHEAVTLVADGLASLL